VKIKYIGTAGSKVFLPGYGEFEKGVVVEVSDDIGETLIRRPDFEEVKPVVKPKAKPKEKKSEIEVKSSG